MRAACRRVPIESVGAGASIRREPEIGGHRMLWFGVGIFFPLFWLIGALMPPTRAAYERV
jgi:hypothetical protein